jgi:hypothetical protein
VYPHETLQRVPKGQGTVQEYELWLSREEGTNLSVQLRSFNSGSSVQLRERAVRYILEE